MSSRRKVRLNSPETVQFKQELGIKISSWVPQRVVMLAESDKTAKVVSILS